MSITNTLSGFHLRDWVVTAYFIAYTGFLIIYAKLGDVFGRKTMYLLGLGTFIIFSCLCGASTDIVELQVSTYHLIPSQAGRLVSNDCFIIIALSSGPSKEWVLLVSIP